MKLLNRSILYISIPMLIIIGAWAIVFYYNMLKEIKDSIDEGLENYKRYVIYKAQRDSSILQHATFDESFYAIREIPLEQAIHNRDTYIDTLILMQDADDLKPEPEPVRMLTTAFHCDNHYYELRIINPMLEEGDLISHLFWDTVVLYILLLLSIILISNYALQRLWKPFYYFLAQLKQYRLGSNKPLPHVKTTTSEFQDLQTAVQTLLKHNLQVYEQQKQFIGNASHELQTPLAIASGKLELLLDNPELSSEQSVAIAEIIEVVQRMKRLNKSLLLLSRIENKQFIDEDTVSINEILEKARQDLGTIAEFKDVSFILREEASLTVSMNKSLADILVYNLLRNAVFHNQKHGKIVINLKPDTLSIANTGDPNPLHSDEIFYRFRKSSQGSEGTGLGLAIVKAITDLYGFRIKYENVDGMHAFEVVF